MLSGMLGLDTLVGPRSDDWVRALEVATGLSSPPQAREDLHADEDEQKLVKLVDRLYRETDSKMWPWRRIWGLNESYYRGNFGDFWNPTNKRIETRPGWGNRGPGVHLNGFRPTINTWVARMLATKPQFKVAPGSTDQDVVDAARLTTRVGAEYEWHQQRMDDVRKRFVLCMKLFGTGILKGPVWNPRGGRYLGQFPVPKRENGQLVQAMVMGPEGPIPQFKPDGAPVWENERDEITGEEVMVDAWEGCNETEVRHPEDVLVPIEATKPWDCPWFMDLKEMHCATIFSEYGVRVKPDGESLARDSVFARAGVTQLIRGKPAWDRQSCLVKELWIAPGEYPYGDGPEDKLEIKQGYVVTVAGGKVLSKGPWYYDEAPFIFAFDSELEKQFWGETSANDLRGLQASTLKTAEQIVRNGDLSGNPMIFYTARSGVDEADKTNRPGAWIKGTWLSDADRPFRLEGSGASPAVFRWFEGLQSRWWPFISGNHEGGLAGGSPPNVEAAAAFIELAERDATFLMPGALSYGLALQTWFERTMKNVKQFWTTERYISVAGRGAAYEVFAFKSTDVRDSFTYSVVPESVVPQSAAARFQKAFSLFQLRDEAGKPVLGKRDLMRRIGEDEHDEASLEQKMATAAKLQVLDAQQNHAFSTPDELMDLADPEIFLEEYAAFLFDPRAQDDPQAFALVLGRALALKQQMQMKAMEAAGPPPGAPPGASEGPQTTKEPATGRQSSQPEMASMIARAAGGYPPAQMTA